MRLLLDTSTLIWLANQERELTPAAMHAYEDLSNSIYLSAVTSWEIAQKVNIAKLTLRQPLEMVVDRFVAERSVQLLPFRHSAALRLLNLPLLHRDPFDRMLICQALDSDLTILTSDANIRRYDVPVLW